MTAEGTVVQGKDFTENVCRAINKITDVGKHLRAYCCRAIAEYGISLNEMDVLLSLGEHPEENTVRQISKNAHLSKGTISQAIESLRKKAFVSVRPDESDRRSVLVTLNSVSLPVLSKIREASTAFVQKVMSGIPYEELHATLSIVSKVYQNKEHMGKERKDNSNES